MRWHLSKATWLLASGVACGPAVALDSDETSAAASPGAGPSSDPTTVSDPPSQDASTDAPEGSSTTDVPGSGPGTTTEVGDDEATTSTTSTSGTTDDTTVGVVACEAPMNLQPCDSDTDDPFAAIGLGCPGGADEAIPISGASFDSPDPDAWIVTHQFGTAVDAMTGLPVWGPREGEALLWLFTGPLGSSGNNDNPDEKSLPAPMSALPGSNGGVGGTPFAGCDGINDCSDTLSGFSDSPAHDLLTFQFETDVPAGTHGYSIDFALFSMEYPEWVGTTYNDALVVWSNSETYTGNVCVVGGGAPCSVTSLWPVAYAGNAPELAGTGFQGNGATAWHRIRGSAEPGETLQLTFAIFDANDTTYDTLVLLDRFAWECDCDPTAGPCVGVAPL